MREEFINFLNLLMDASPDIVEQNMTDNIKVYIQALSDSAQEKPILTDNGKVILTYMQQTQLPLYKARDIAEEIGISSRAVSGALRKLVNDGFCEKVGKEPVLYSLTEQGKNFNIEGN